MTEREAEAQCSSAASDPGSLYTALFTTMARNNHWSNARLLAACAQLSDDEYCATRPSFFGSIHATLNHIVVVDLLYLGRMSGEELVPPDCVILHDELAALTLAQVEADTKVLDFCEAQTPASLGASCTFRLVNGEQYTETIAAVLAHLFVHQVHHRGQVHDMLSATAVAPPQLDEFFLAGDLSLREAEVRALGLPVV